ncbi:hypothetical protein ABPG72_021672 [Tetrahymena utriculariae]
MDTTTIEPLVNSQQKKLILHFDINKTLVLADTRLRHSKEDSLNLLLSKYAWGRIEQKDSESYWKLVTNHFSFTKPEEDLISYNQYINSLLPEITTEQEPSQEKRDEENKQINLKRQLHYNTFCRSSSPGMKLKPEYDRILKNISIPANVQEDIKQQIEKIAQQQGKQLFDANQNTQRIFKSDQECVYPTPSKYLQFFQDGKYQILPGFYRMIIQLLRLKRDFSIVFHSFADNLYDIIAEFNLFCRGEHPCYNGKNNTPQVRLDGVRSQKNFIINERSMGLVYRYSEDVNESALVMGTLKRVPKIKHLEDEYEKELEEDSITIHKGIHNIYSYLKQMSLEKGAFALNHDYQFWVNNGQKNQFSKPLIIDSQNLDALHIFFDDNITEGDDCIIDLREAVTGQQIPIKKSIDKYLVAISMLDLLRDPDYLLKCIDTCEKKRDEEIYRIVNGISEEEVKNSEKSKFQLLQESDKSDYLRHTVLPLLYPAFQLVDKERPHDPISFIALYCLKNQDKVKVPTPNEEYLQEHQQKYKTLEKIVQSDKQEGQQSLNKL